MNWTSLKVNKCPQCNYDWGKNFVPLVNKVINCKCGFKISEARFKEIISNLISKKSEKHYRPKDEEPEY